MPQAATRKLLAIQLPEIMTEKKALCVQGLLPFFLLVFAVIAALVTGRLQWVLESAPFLMVLIVPAGILWLKGLIFEE